MSAGLVTASPDAAERHAQGTLERALTAAFWQALQREPMHVMAALEAAARTVGALYRQAAAVHGPNGSCGCGWEPDPDCDLIVLEANLAAALMQPPEPDLARMAVLGSA